MRRLPFLALVAVAAFLVPTLASGTTTLPPAADAFATTMPAFAAGPDRGYVSPLSRDLGPDGLADAAEDDLSFELVDVASAFGPESYKTDDLLNSRNPNDVDNQSANWDAALGHMIEFVVSVDAAEGVTLSCDTRFDPVAYIETSGGRLYGWTNGTASVPDATSPCPGVPGVRTFRMFFDLDGAPNNAGGEPFPALTSGGAVATLELYYLQSPTVTNPSGRGPLAGTYEVAFSIFNPLVTLRDEQVMRFPDAIYRMFTDVGPGTEANMPMRALLPPVNASTAPVVEMRFQGSPVGTPFEVVGWFPVRVAPSTQPPATVPEDPTTPLPGLTEKVTRADDRSVELRECNFSLEAGNDTVPSEGVRYIAFPSFCRDTPDAASPDHWPINVIGTHIPANLTARSTGVGVLVVPLSERNFETRGLEVSSIAGAPLTGATEITLHDPAKVTGGAAGTNAGDLHALRITGLGHTTIAKSRLSRPSDSQWVTGSVPHLAFTDVGQYDLLSMLYGARDEFLGLTVVRRGLDLGADSIRLTDGRDGAIRLGVRSLTTDFDSKPGEDIFEMDVQVASTGLPGASQFNDTIEVAEDQTRDVQVNVVQPPKGDYTVRFVATSGELVQRLDVGVQVAAKGDGDKKWYSPAPSAALVVVALLGLALVLRRRL